MPHPLFLGGAVTGSETPKATASMIIRTNPRGLMHRTSPTISVTEGPGEDRSSEKTGALRKKTTKRNEMNNFPITLSFHFFYHFKLPCLK
jgi:hypothetical protein